MAIPNSTPGEARRPLVPDLAFLSYERMPLDIQEATDEILVAPDVVVEILSSDDRPRDVEEKVRVYLVAGTNVVFLVDTERETVAVRDARGERGIPAGSVLEHETLPDFRLPISRLFSPTPPK